MERFLKLIVQIKLYCSDANFAIKFHIKLTANVTTGETAANGVAVSVRSAKI